MQINSSSYQLLCGSDNPEILTQLPSLKPFQPLVCEALSTLSKMLLAEASVKQYPDIVTFAFFCRKANIEKLKSEFYCASRLGRGIIFHIAPSNVPINFAYSLVAGLLSGNVNVVKASSKDFSQTKIISEKLNDLLNSEYFSTLNYYANIVMYDRDLNEYTEKFSKLCNIRVIWGGDNTITNIRTAPLPPRAFDITFADRYSICVIGAKSVLNLENTTELAHNFYNDTYLYDQNACSSPKLIYWVGTTEEIYQASAKFWNSIHNFSKDKYTIDPKIAVDKYMTVCKSSIELQATAVKTTDNLVTVINVNQLDKNILDYKCAGGVFFQYQSENLEVLKEVITLKCQTISYFGLNNNDILDVITVNGLKGADRIVPIGQTADFSLLWDGYDLINTFSRHISCN